MSNTYQNAWPPDEPITPAGVVARLDTIGWTAERTVLVEHTDRHALAAYDDGQNPVHFVIVNLVDGHTIGGHYGTEDGARAAFAVVARRNGEGGGERS